MLGRELLVLLSQGFDPFAAGFSAAKFSDSVLASHAFENNSDLFFGGLFSSGLAADIANGCFDKCFLLHDEIIQIDGKVSLNSKLQFVS